MENLYLNDVSCGYVNKKSQNIVLEHLTFSVHKGDFLVILGESGCGKSTLLRSIAGFLPYSGNIYYDNKNIDKLEVKDRNMAYITQDNNLYPRMTIFDNLAYPLKISKVPYDEINKRVEDVANMLNISFLLTRKPKELSLGQQQKVAIAKAILRRVDLFLFDEPMSAIDNVSKIEFEKLLKELNEKLNITIIYVTHNIKEASFLATNVIILHDKKIIQQGTFKDIYDNPINDYVKSYIRDNITNIGDIVNDKSI